MSKFESVKETMEKRDTLLKVFYELNKICESINSSEAKDNSKEVHFKKIVKIFEILEENLDDIEFYGYVSRTVNDEILRGLKNNYDNIENDLKSNFIHKIKYIDTNISKE